MTEDYEVLVIGGGPAGTAAALRAAELGARVALVEADRLGGTCVNTGCVPTRVLAKAARTLRDIRGAGEYGIVVPDPSVAWERTRERMREVIEDVRASKHDEQDLRSAGVDLHLGERARFTGPHRVRLDGGGRELEARTVILCVGGESRRLPIPGVELALSAERVPELDRLPASVAIVGSGSTGSQLATIFDAFGAQVTLLEVQDSILPGTDHDTARTVTEGFRRHGITVETGIEAVEQLERTAEGMRLRYRAGGDQRAIEAGAVVFSVGWPARLGGLGLEAAGVQTRRGYIPVNAYQQTNVPHVYAAGDADGNHMLVQAAGFEAEAAATNAVLGPTRSVPHALLPSGGFTDPDYAGVGLTEAQARDRDRDCLVAHVPYTRSERAIIDGRTGGFLKLIADRRRSILLGAHAAGEQAVEVIQAVATAMAAGIDVATLARVEFAYPTYTAIVGEAARRLLAEPVSVR